jgi:two-component system sensor histidine kinase YesM
MGVRVRSIAVRHLSSFFLLIALPTLAVILFSGYAFRQEIIRITTEQRYGVLEQTASGLDSRTQDIALMASALIHDRALIERSLAYVSASSSKERYLVTVSLDGIFNRFFILTKQLGSFYVFFTDGSGPYVCRNDTNVSWSDDEVRNLISAGAKRPGFIEILDTVGSPDSGGSYRPAVSIVVDPSKSTGLPTGVRSIFLSFKLSALDDFIEQRNDVSRNSGKYISHSFLVGRNGTVLASGDRRMVGKIFADVKKELGSGYLVMERSVDSPQWIIAEAIDIKSLTQNVDRLMWYIYAALAVMLVLFVRYNFVFFSQMVSPLNELVREMDTVAKGNFSARVEPSGFPELDKLGASFNVMVSEIDHLTSEIKAEQKERVRAEIEALRYQLNPHFLCNTLNSIRMMAMISKNDAIQKMTSALMTITEDNLGRDDTVHSLAHEMRNIDSYVYIMKVRYGDSFGFYADIDSSLMDIGVPSMILQPIVENAILHGVHGLPRPGSITVAAERREDSLRIDVRDNGFGMSEDRLSRLFDAHDGTDRGLNRIGLYNVRRRIVLLYGAPYGVEVSSYPGEGTVVTLTLPVLASSEAVGRFDAEEKR